MDDLRLLRHFEAVYRLLSFSNAAEELNLTHSTLTKSIKTLEESWGVKLFHRTTRNVAPTEAGKRLFPMARDLLSFADAVKSETQGGEHILHVVTGPAILDTLIHPAIARFTKTYPRTRIVAETMPPTQAMEELIQRRIHLLLYHEETLARLPHFDRLRVTNLVTEPYFTICRPGHEVLKSGRALADIVQHDWAIAGFDSHFEASLSVEVQALLRKHDFPKYRLLSQAACIELVTSSDILSAIPKSSAEALIESGKVEGFVHPQQLEFSVSAAVLHDAGTEPTVSQFIECLH